MNKTLPISIIMLVETIAEIDWSRLANYNWAEEIMLVVTSDKKQRDSIPAPAKPPNIRIVTTRPIVNFAETRNDAMQLSRCEWVFFLDSDEWIEQSSYDTVAPLIQDRQTAWSFTRQDYFLGKPLRYGEPAKVRVIRLFYKTTTRFVGAVHEVPMVNGVVLNSSLVIHHHAHQSITGFWHKISWYAQLAAKNRTESLTTTVVQLLTFPLAKWLYNFVLLRGFLDGWRGLVYATLMSCHSLMVRLYRIESLLNSYPTAKPIK